MMSSIKKVNFFSKFTIFTIIFFSAKNAESIEFYKIDEPNRKILSQNYKQEIDEEDQGKNTVDIDLINNDFIRKSDKLYAEKHDAEIKIAKDNEEKLTKRQRFEQQNKLNNSGLNYETSIKEKENSKSFMDKLLPFNQIKPMEMVGVYTRIGFLLTLPMPMKFHANEMVGYDNYKNVQLFSGNAKYRLMPAISLAVGNDRFKLWRWEAEIGFSTLLSTGISNFYPSKDMSEYAFSIENKDLSMHLMTLSFNNFLQHAFFDNRLVGFVGLGLGVGYAWSMGKALSSDFVMPIVTSHLGISFMVGKKSKINIAYTMLYSQMSLPNRYGFSRKKTSNANSNNYASRGGRIKFNQLLINGISIEYLFYTA